MDEMRMPFPEIASSKRKRRPLLKTTSCKTRSSRSNQMFKAQTRMPPKSRIPSSVAVPETMPIKPLTRSQSLRMSREWILQSRRKSLMRSSKTVLPTTPHR